MGNFGLMRAGWTNGWGGYQVLWRLWQWAYFLLGISPSIWTVLIAVIQAANRLGSFLQVLCPSFSRSSWYVPTDFGMCVQRYISIRSAELIHQVLVQETSPFPLVLASCAVVAFEVCLTFLPQHHLCIPSPTLWFKCMLYWFLDTKSLGFIFLKSSVIWMKFICQGHQNW